MSDSAIYELTDLQSRLESSDLNSGLIERLRKKSTKKVEEFTSEDSLGNQ
ncbi:MAG: hypothetical protein ACR2PX_09265 [Endozoicomonas sp.]